MRWHAPPCNHHRVRRCQRSDAPTREARSIACTMPEEIPATRSPPPHRKDQQCVTIAEARPLEPRRKESVPAFVVRASRELGDIVGGRVSFEMAKFAKVVHRMTRMSCRASDSQSEQLPPRSRVDASPIATSSIAAGSISSSIARVSSRNEVENKLVSIKRVGMLRRTSRARPRDPKVYQPPHQEQKLGDR